MILSVLSHEAYQFLAKSGLWEMASGKVKESLLKSRSSRKEEAEAVKRKKELEDAQRRWVAKLERTEAAKVRIYQMHRWGGASLNLHFRARRGRRRAARASTFR